MTAGLVVAAYLGGPFFGTLLAGLILSPVHARQIADRFAEVFLADERPGRRRHPDDRGGPQHAVGTATSPARPMSVWDTQMQPLVWPPDATRQPDTTQPVQRIPRNDTTAQFGRIR